jgi:hypothetical protein
VSAFLSALLSITASAAQMGPVAVALVLGCPPDADPASAEWPGLRVLVAITRARVPFHAQAPDGAVRAVSARATAAVADALASALDVLALPPPPAADLAAPTATPARAAARAAALERAFALALLAQTVDAGIVNAHAESLARYAGEYACAARARALDVHAFAGGGRALAGGIAARSALWAALLRAAMLRLPLEPGISPLRAGSRDVARAYAARILAADTLTLVVRALLPSDTPLISASHGCPPALAPLLGTFCLRAEGGAHLFTFAALLTSARAARDVFARAHASGVGSAAALSAAYSLRTDGASGNGGKSSVAEASRRGVGPRETALTDAADAAGAPNGTLFQQARADAADDDAADAAADAADFAALDAVVATFTESVSAIISTEGILPAERASASHILLRVHVPSFTHALPPFHCPLLLFPGARLWASKDVMFAPTVPAVLTAAILAAHA